MIAAIETLQIGSANRETYQRNAIKGMREVLRFARPRRVRPLLDFAEQELRYPTGRFRGQKFSRTYQPATSLLMAELSLDYWLQTFVVGPHQGGKSFSIIAWMLWCLFEKQEDVIFGLPDLGMRSTKWRKDILPMIQASAYRAMLPRSGSGSKGGVAEIIVFQNGVSCQFMGAGGGDTQRAGATATEPDCDRGGSVRHSWRRFRGSQQMGADPGACCAFRGVGANHRRVNGHR
jgi:hypothetical protein